jgi:hypothetical protein
MPCPIHTRCKVGEMAKKSIILAILLVLCGCQGVDLDLKGPGHEPVVWKEVAPEGYVTEKKYNQDLATMFWIGVLAEKKANQQKMHVAPVEPWKLDPNSI